MYNEELFQLFKISSDIVSHLLLQNGEDSSKNVLLIIMQILYFDYHAKPMALYSSSDIFFYKIKYSILHVFTLILFMNASICHCSDFLVFAVPAFFSIHHWNLQAAHYLSQP